MDKGILVIFAIGAAFIYFALHMFSISDGTNDLEREKRSADAPYAQYYKKDVLGDPVLDLSSVPLSQAKTIWSSTPTEKKVAEKLPDFSLAKTEVQNKLSDGAFKQFLLHYLENLEGRYLSGEVDGDQAKEALAKLK